MPLVSPFRAHLYRHEPGADISSRVAPPYDVISPEQRATLLGSDAHNVVALELPDGPLDPSVPGNRYETGARTWQAWLDADIVVPDSSDAIYVLEQVWEHEGHHIRRRALIAAVRLHPFSDGVVLPHERTLPKALSDRFQLLRSTSVNLSQVFGLFSDPAGETDDILESAMADLPLLVATDAEGVTSRLWAIREAATIASVQAIVAEGPIFIADGHHRYTTALAYRDERRARALDAGETPVEPAYDRVMMALVNMDGPDLVVLPTHRLAKAAGDFQPGQLWTALAEHFELADAPPYTEALLTGPGRTAMLVRTADGVTRLATLKPGADPAELIPGDHSAEWKRLDVAVLQELVLKPVFGISQEDPRSLERLTFAKDAHRALVDTEADAVFILAPTRMEQLRAVATGGETMPQKSTYFYPKLLSGLVFRALG